MRGKAYKCCHRRRHYHNRYCNCRCHNHRHQCHQLHRQCQHCQHINIFFFIVIIVIIAIPWLFGAQDHCIHTRAHQFAHIRMQQSIKMSHAPLPLGYEPTLAEITRGTTDLPWWGYAPTSCDGLCANFNEEKLLKQKFDIEFQKWWPKHPNGRPVTHLFRFIDGSLGTNLLFPSRAHRYVDRMKTQKVLAWSGDAVLKYHGTVSYTHLTLPTKRIV